MNINYIELYIELCKINKKVTIFAQTIAFDKISFRRKMMMKLIWNVSIICEAIAFVVFFQRKGPICNLNFAFQIYLHESKREEMWNERQIRSEENLKSSSDVNNPFHSKLKLWLVLIS